LVEVILALLQAVDIASIPSQASQLRSIVRTDLSKQGIARVEEGTGIVDQLVGINAGEAVG
jgi:hypothetical protein